MRASLIVLAVVLATLHFVRGALARRRRAFVPSRRGSGAAALGASELSLVEGVAVGSGPAEMGRRRWGRGNAARADAGSSRFAEWRYYGFSTHAAEADAAVAQSPARGGSPPPWGPR